MSDQLLELIVIKPTGHTGAKPSEKFRIDLQVGEARIVFADLQIEGNERAVVRNRDLLRGHWISRNGRRIAARTPIRDGYSSLQACHCTGQLCESLPTIWTQLHLEFGLADDSSQIFRYDQAGGVASAALFQVSNLPAIGTVL